MNCIQDWSRPLKSLCFFVVLAIEFVHCAVLAVYSLSALNVWDRVLLAVSGDSLNPYRTHSGIIVNYSRMAIRSHAESPLLNIPVTNLRDGAVQVGVLFHIDPPRRQDGG